MKEILSFPNGLNIHMTLEAPFCSKQESSLFCDSDETISKLISVFDTCSKVHFCIRILHYRPPVIIFSCTVIFWSVFKTLFISYDETNTLSKYVSFIPLKTEKKLYDHDIFSSMYMVSKLFGTEQIRLPTAKESFIGPH